jgi:hypothetical protein
LLIHNRIPLVQTSISQMSSPPYNPSVSEIEAKFFSNAPWNSPSYIVSLLEDTGFVNVQYEQKALTAGVGSAEMSVSSIFYLPESFFCRLTVCVLFFQGARNIANAPDRHRIVLARGAARSIDPGDQSDHVERVGKDGCGWSDADGV